MDKQGMTLVELLVVLSIIGILAMGLGFTYQDWVEKYKVEITTKGLYTDMMNARVKAMERGCEYYVVLNERSYSIVADTNGNGKRDAGDATAPNFPKPTVYSISKNGSGSTITFNQRGIISGLRTIWFTSDAAPDYNCMTVAMTRIVMGWYTNGDCHSK